MNLVEIIGNITKDIELKETSKKLQQELNIQDLV